MAPYIVRISSQKGGVGKSVFATNFASALALSGSKVLLMDVDFINPSVANFLGVTPLKKVSADFVSGKADMKEVIVWDTQTHLDIMPGGLRSRFFASSKKQISNMFGKLKKLNYDHIIIDTAPGVATEEALAHYDEAIILTNPDLTSCISAVKLAEEYDHIGVKRRLVVNRVKNKRYELSVPEIEEMYGEKTLCVLPEDEKVQQCVASQTPIYLTYPEVEFSRRIKEIVRLYTPGNARGIIGTLNAPDGEGLIEAIRAFLRRILGL